MMSEELPFPFAQLPIELTHEIIKIFVRTSPPQDSANLVRVCRFIHNWAVPFLYESVFLSTARQILLFASTLEKTPRLRPIVTNLWIFVAERDISGAHSFSDVIDEAEDRSNQDEADELNNEGESDDDYQDGSTEDEVLESEAVPEDFSDEDTCVYTAFQKRPPGSPYEFTPVFGPQYSGRNKVSSALRFFRCVAKPESFIQAHQVIILSHCRHLRSLTILTDPLNDGLSSTMNVFALGGLVELAIHDMPPDLFDRSLPQVHDYSTLTHLRLLDTPQSLSHVIPLRAPNITHLQMWRDTCPWTREALANLKCLSHLWLTPSRGGSTSPPLSEFLRSLHEQCHALTRVRIDAGPDEDLDIDTALFPFVHVHRYAYRDISWDAETMWLAVQKDTLRISGQDLIRESREPKEEYNVYTARLEEYWRLRCCGGGWDD